MNNLSKKNKFKFKYSLEIIKKSIHRIDPYGLFASGSPEDEFDSEINSIAIQLNRCKSGKDIAYAIARVLNSSFSENDSYTLFEEEGNKIYEELIANNFI